MIFIIIFGPPAVGKMAVGRELTKITGLKLLHNHMSIEFVREFFEFGTPKFNKLNSEFRRRIFEEVATSNLPGLIFTYVWAFNMEEEKEYVDKICDIFRKEGGTIYYVELEADLEERLRRNKEATRLLEKPSKQELELSEKRLLSTSEKYIMNTTNDFYYKENYLKINNTNLSLRETAKKIKKVFNL
ncbi:MAG: AAA family ATPase [Candidatus Heimdallarchaeota archaeon]|nr:AAA family ATPase [Candidatus Heimdallarchaeota archaeon]MCK4955645.1 AAA family ATPase [Candidatus Heimdallarchaeota archaeon]